MTELAATVSAIRGVAGAASARTIRMPLALLFVVAAVVVGLGVSAGAMARTTSHVRTSHAQTVDAQASPAQTTLVQTSHVAWRRATGTRLDPALRLPAGARLAHGPGADAWAARLGDAAAWRDAETYLAPGVPAPQRAAFVRRLVGAFVAGGYVESSRDLVPDDAGTRMRIVFEGYAGDRMVLVAFDAPEDLVWLIAAAR